MTIELNNIPEINPKEVAKQELGDFMREFKVPDEDKNILLSQLENSNYLQTGINIRLRQGLPLDKVA